MGCPVGLGLDSEARRLIGSSLTSGPHRIAYVSGNADRQPPRPSHLAPGPADPAGVGEVEHGKRVEPRLEGDAQLHAGQVRARAAMRTEAERHGAVRLAIDDDAV